MQRRESVVFATHMSTHATEQISLKRIMGNYYTGICHTEDVQNRAALNGVGTDLSYFSFSLRKLAAKRGGVCTNQPLPPCFEDGHWKRRHMHTRTFNVEQSELSTQYTVTHGLSDTWFI